jgi:hypothetical protein
VPFNNTFTDQQWLEACEMQGVVLGYMMTHETRALTFSRMLRKPLDILKYKVDTHIQKSSEVNEAWDKVKYVQYSDHDDQLLNIVIWLNPTNYNMTYVNFAASLFMELHYPDGCNTEDCFTVWIFFNGLLLEFDDYCAINNKCTYPEFVAMMDAIAYQGLNADDLNKACD